MVPPSFLDIACRITSGGESLIDVMITSCAAGYWESGCRDCCLSDHQMIYGIKTEVTNSDGNNMLNIRQCRAFHKWAFQGDLYRKCTMAGHGDF